MARCKTETCCLTLPLIVEKWQADRLEKRFEQGRQLYNTIVRKGLKRLRHVERTREYREIKKRIDELYQADKSGVKQSEEYESLNKQRSQMLKDAKLTEFGFSKMMTKLYKCFAKNIDANTAQAISKAAWGAFEKYLYGTGKTIHFRRYGDMRSLSGRYNKTGIRYRDGTVSWKELTLTVKVDANNNYEQRMLQHKIKYCRLLKKCGKNKTRYYVQLVLEGRPEQKYQSDSKELRYPTGTGTVGLDIGPQTLAYSSQREVGLVELADRVQGLEREKRILQRRLDRSRRATNPNNYNADGTIRRGVKLTHHKSKHYLKTQHKLAYIQSRQAEIRKLQHNLLADHLLTLGDTFYIEDMSFSGLARRAKKTEISEKTGRYKRKKRFGKSIGNKAPAMLVTILNNKLKARGLSGVIEVSTRARASQYDHLTQTYHSEKGLNQRINCMADSRLIQRDMYSAFLLQHMVENWEELSKQKGQYCWFDQRRLEQDYPQFAAMQDAELRRLEQLPKVPDSMGLPQFRAMCKLTEKDVRFAQ